MSSNDIISEDPADDDVPGSMCSFPGMCKGIEDQLNAFTVRRRNAFEPVSEDSSQLLSACPFPSCRGLVEACGHPDDLPEPVLTVLEKVGVVETVEVPVDEENQSTSHSYMQNNQQLLEERGRKVNSASQKSGKLVSGAQDYASMARQLKEKTMQQKSEEKSQGPWSRFRKSK